MKRKKQARTNHRRISERELQRELRYFVALCRAALEEYSTAEVAALAGLSDGTVHRLFTGETRYPRFLTIQRVGAAAGLYLVLTKHKVIKMLAG